MKHKKLRKHVNGKPKRIKSNEETQITAKRHDEKYKQGTAFGR